LDRDAIRTANVRGNTRAESTVQDTESATIPVKAERLVVGKRAVEGARVRIYGRVIEKPVEETVQLHDEKIVVERRPVDRLVRDDDRSATTEFEIRETHEEPVVGKEERIVEEVVIGKISQDRTETVRDKVRRTEVEVERSGDNKLRDERHR
jgi:stress response protein YsnF